MSELTAAQRRALRARAHSLQPVVSISQQGLTDAVLAEIDRSLKAHELLKVRVYGVERGEREALLAGICARLEAAPVQHIGNILVIFRENPAETKPATAQGQAKAGSKAARARPTAPRRRARS